MTLFFDLVGLLLVLVALALVAWLAAGGLLLPPGLPLRVTVAGEGPGDGLEQTVRALLWLRKLGLWRGAVIIEDHGLSEAGLLLAAALARQSGVEFTVK